MGGVIEAGGALLSQASRRLEISASNISNIATPGYRARIAHQSGVTGFSALLDDNVTTAAVDWRPGNLSATNNPLDLSIAGDGFFMVKGVSGDLLTRNGQFRRDGEGRLVDANGLAVQSSSGDIILASDTPEILADGTILDRGEPVARLQLAKPGDLTRLERQGAYFAAPGQELVQSQSAIVHQRMIETSNVSMASEVLAMMQSQRNAESGQTLVRLYDDLMGRALTAFGQFGS